MTSKVEKFVGVFAVAACALSCGDTRTEDTTGAGTETEGITSASASSPVTTMDTTSGTTPGSDTEVLDMGQADTEALPGCQSDECNQVDVVFVIDNSGTMGEEQVNLAANLPRLVEQLQTLKDMNGDDIEIDVNIMVTTTDMGHPLCTPFQKADYLPRQGAPVATGCNARINRFTGLELEDPLMVPEACTASCPADVAPGGPFIHFDAERTNVPNDDVAAALSCIGPQGIDGCGYEAPLESMLQAINPDACWNNPDQDRCANDPEWANVNRGFLRENAVLAVAVITDESDCSVTPPEGFSFFTDDQKYWEENPELEINQATSAVCWKSGVRCDDDDGDGIYEGCATRANDEVLHDVDRYITYLKWLREETDKEVIMLGIVGIPSVTAHNPDPPFEPTEGGVFDLEYRDWIDGEYDGTDMGGDILPDEWALGVNADFKRFEFGNVGPGCTGQDGDGNFTGQAIPPVRIKKVCQSLDYTDDDGEEQIRCCMESICDEDFSAAIDCLSGLIQGVVGPIG